MVRIRIVSQCIESQIFVDYSNGNISRNKHGKISGVKILLTMLKIKVESTLNENNDKSLFGQFDRCHKDYNRPTSLHIIYVYVSFDWRVLRRKQAEKLDTEVELTLRDYLKDHIHVLRSFYLFPSRHYPAEPEFTQTSHPCKQWGDLPSRIRDRSFDRGRKLFPPMLFGASMSLTHYKFAKSSQLTLARLIFGSLVRRFLRSL